MPSVKTLTIEQRFWAKVDRRGPQECWLWRAAVNESGYGVLRPDTARRNGPTVKAHRLSAKLAGMQVEGMKVLHSCDNPPCVNPAHLRPGTMAENSADMVKRWRTCYGERRPQSKLTDAAVVEIRRRRRAGEQRAALAREFGVSGATITRAASGAGWKHVPDPDAVTAPVAEVIMSALVECITGEALDRSVPEPAVMAA
jgi:hypothetical protein